MKALISLYYMQRMGMWFCILFQAGTMIQYHKGKKVRDGIIPAPPKLLQWRARTKPPCYTTTDHLLYTHAVKCNTAMKLNYVYLLCLSISVTVTTILVGVNTTYIFLLFYTVGYNKAAVAAYDPI